MAKRQNPFGGAPRMGNAAPGEPSPTPLADGVDGYGGAPTLQGGLQNRGSKVLNPTPSSAVFPEVYGGGNAQVTRPNQAPAKGSGDGTGPGAVSGSTQNGGAGVP